MNNFEEATNRLKTQLRVRDDKEASEALGISATAWAMRKKRDSFPTKEVFALAAQRPDLALDPDWIVTGLSNKMETDGNAEASLLQCYRIMSAHDRKTLVKIAVSISDVVNLSSEEITRRLSNYKP